MFYGWYSPQADKQCGHCIYSKVNGEMTRVTFVTSDPSPLTPSWPDLFSVGEVETCLYGYGVESPHIEPPKPPKPKSAMCACGIFRGDCTYHKD